MRTRNCLLIAFCFIILCGKLYAQPTGSEDRMYWVQTLTRIADPVLVNLSQGTLKKNMPFESLSDEPLRRSVSYLEAVGRTVCGIAPWLELGPDDTQEGKLRERYIQLVVKGLKQTVDPQSADYLMFDNRHSQPLVDAAFLVQGLLRAPRQLWGNLDVDIQVDGGINNETMETVMKAGANLLVAGSYAFKGDLASNVRHIMKDMDKIRGELD